jgi:hypothetical protein
VGLQFFEQYVNSWIAVAAPFQGEVFTSTVILSLVVAQNVIISCDDSDLKKTECGNLVSRCSRVHHGLPAHRSRVCQGLATAALCGQVEYASACMNFNHHFVINFSIWINSLGFPMDSQE